MNLVCLCKHLPLLNEIMRKDLSLYIYIYIYNQLSLVLYGDRITQESFYCDSFGICSL